MQGHFLWSCITLSLTTCSSTWLQICPLFLLAPSLISLAPISNHRRPPPPLPLLLLGFEGTSSNQPDRNYLFNSLEAAGQICFDELDRVANPICPRWFLCLLSIEGIPATGSLSHAMRRSDASLYTAPQPAPCTMQAPTDTVCRSIDLMVILSSCM